MTYEEFAKFGLQLPGTEEVTGKGGPCVNRDGRGMFWLKKWELLCIHTDWENHDRLLDEHPDVIYKTPHFDEYPAVHAHLDRLSPELARELVQIAWDFAPNKIHYRRRPKV